MKITTRLMERAGFEVGVAVNGIEAVKAVKEEHWDLVLMDCQIPEMDGFQATELIRGLELEGIHMPIVAMTANAIPGDRETCLESGMDGYVSKPVDMDLLYAEIERTMQRLKAA